VAEPLTLRIARSQSSYLEELLRLLEESEGEPTVTGQVLEYTVREALAMPPMVQGLWREIVQAMASGGIGDYAACGQAIFTHVRQCLTHMRRVALYVEREEKKLGASTTPLEELRHATEELDAWRKQATRTWPWPPTDEEWGKIKEDVAQGKGIDMEDAFAAIAGTSRADWLRRVEARKQEIQASGQGGV